MSGDLISRQAVKDWFCTNYCSEHNKCEHFEKGDCNAMIELFAIPSVTPQEPKTGHWIEKDGFDGDVYYDCSECGESWTTIEGTPWDNEWDYCPSCGAKMVEPQESEE